MPRILIAREPSAYLPTALEILRRSGVVAIPTETVYGLAASLLNSIGVERIFALKGRPEERPLPIQFASIGGAKAFGFHFTPAAARLAEAFWPGPLTLVLERPAAAPPWFAPRADALAVRVPDHPVALALLRAFGHPLAVTSANASGARPALEVPEILAAFPEAEDLLVLDGGRCPGRAASSVVDARGPMLSLLRPGPLSLDSLEEVWRR